MPKNSPISLALLHASMLSHAASAAFAMLGSQLDTGPSNAAGPQHMRAATGMSKGIACGSRGGGLAARLAASPLRAHARAHRYAQVDTHRAVNVRRAEPELAATASHGGPACHLAVA